MERSTLMSPMRSKPPAHAGSSTNGPRTPVMIRTSDHAMYNPSPNRSEAATAMMHLFTSSSSLANPSTKARATSGVLKPKRRYVRKAPPRKLETPSDVSTTAATTDAKAEAAADVPATVNNSSSSTHIQQRATRAADNTRASTDDDQAPPCFAFREYNRKDKSLGLLCEKCVVIALAVDLSIPLTHSFSGAIATHSFLKLYRSRDNAEICLDRAATALGVERRRIYDIVNILESIHLVSRKSKNVYNWHGLAALPVSITAMRERYAALLQQHEDPHRPTGPCSYDYNFQDRRRGKSLSKLSQLFVELFLHEEHCIIPLDQAAKQLIQLEANELEADRLLKTKIRRLYDVANVLVSVGLIEKLQLSNVRKPVFRWRVRPSGAASTSSSSTAAAAAAVDATMTPVDTAATTDDDAFIKAEVTVATASIDLQCYEAARVPTPSRANESDSFDESNSSNSSSSDSQSDDNLTTARNSNAVLKRQLPDTADRSSSTASTTTAATKRSKTDSRLPLTTHPLLQFDAHAHPVPPARMLEFQHAAVRAFMQQYTREYAAHVAQASAAAIDATTTTATAATSPQSVADLAALENRAAVSTVISVTTVSKSPSPPRNPPQERTTATTSKHDPQPRKLLAELQSTSMTTTIEE